MEIGNVSRNLNIQPQKPVEPTPPPEGNIENRQPPPEPVKPPEVSENKLNQTDSDNLVDVYI